VHERERLLKEGRGLVTPLPFLMANFRGERIPTWVFGLGLSLYDLMALKWKHTSCSPEELRALCPPLTSPLLRGGYRYFDAQTDDARLVLRLILEATQDGALALNYARVEGLLMVHGRVCGVSVRDEAPGAERSAEVRARAVINATGAWADELRQQLGATKRLRLLRGSHLFFPGCKLPLRCAVTFLHPRDGRPVFIFPWEGVTLVGTTDVDHAAAPSTDLRISQAEAEYLMEAVTHAFPALGLTAADVQSTLAGVRAVVDTGKLNPSKESRAFGLWQERGLLTVSGGKLTTFRRMAQKALRAVRAAWPDSPARKARERVLDPLPPEAALQDLPAEFRLRLLGRYGRAACHLVASAAREELSPIASLPALWGELRWAARAEGVVHLEDLLLRRVRLGLLLPHGGRACSERIRAIVQSELGWDEQRWESEWENYLALWQRYYSP